MLNVNVTSAGLGGCHSSAIGGLATNNLWSDGKVIGAQVTLGMLPLASEVLLPQIQNTSQILRAATYRREAGQRCLEDPTGDRD